MNNISNSSQIINKMYDNLTYTDQYSGSIMLTIVLIIILLLVIGYFYSMSKSEEIKKDWVNQRCHPSVLPFAGLINKPEGKSIMDFTSENFEYCTQNILKDITGFILAPIHILLDTLTGLLASFTKFAQYLRILSSNIRNDTANVSKEIYNKGFNLSLAAQQDTITLKDMGAKAHGALVASLYTFLGSFVTLESSLQMIVDGTLWRIFESYFALMLIAYLMPWTISIFFPALLVYMAIFIFGTIVHDGGQAVLDVAMPPMPPSSVSACFDKDTLLKIQGGSVKKISEINVGDILENQNVCTGTLKLDIGDNIMYNLSGTMVTGNHKVLKDNKWIQVYEHPKSKRIYNYSEKMVYCLATSSGKIDHNGEVYTDWSEIETMDKKVLEENILNQVIDMTKMENFKKELDGGLIGGTQLKLAFNKEINIRDIQIGDILEGDIKVLGKVVLDGKQLNNQYRCNLGESIIIGGNNLIIENNKIFKNIVDKDKINNEDKLYHLITNKGYFYVEKCKVFDYNYNFDYFE